MTRRTLACLAALALPLLGGCGPQFLKVTGRVTYKGQPVPSTEVKFVPDTGERPSVGLTDDDGRFVLKYSRTQGGALTGRYKVFLTYVPSNEEEGDRAAPKASKELRAVIAKYGNPETSNLHIEITSNGQFVEIELQ